MALGKYLQEKQLPFLFLLVAGFMCIAFFLLAFSMSGYPSEFQKVQKEDAKSKHENNIIKHDDARPDLWQHRQVVAQNKNNSTSNNKRSAEIEREANQVTVEGTQKQNAEQVIVDSTRMQDANQMAAEDVRKQGDKSILFRRHDDPGLNWVLCQWNGAADFIPCLDNAKAIKRLRSRRHMEHKERHCPAKVDLPRCLLPLPEGYRSHILWPKSRDTIWLKNVPHTKLVEYKKDQNWVRISGKLLVFPGGGTQFKDGALSYINFIEKVFPNVAWGTRTRVVLDVGCGVASFGGYLFDKGVLTMSVAPKDEHEAQIQLALERGIPAILGVIGTQRLVFPSNVYDVVHCARCRVHWHGDGGKPLLEINRILRPGGYFIWSATPVYRDDQAHRDVWTAVMALTESMCWKLVLKTMAKTGVGIAIYQKPTSSSCYMQRKQQDPPLCQEDDRSDAAWYTPLQRCIHQIPSESSVHGSMWPSHWSLRLEEEPLWLKYKLGSTNGSSRGFHEDTAYWRDVVQNLYWHDLSIDWSIIRNVMDMRAGFGGFAAALIEQPVWVMNVIPIDGPDTLPLIFDRGLFGVYHDWCESFNTYPRTYDLLHADHLFSDLTSRCNLVDTILEMDRILRPQGWVIVRDTAMIVKQLLPVMQSLHWRTNIKITQTEENLIVAQKRSWRPETKKVLA